MMVVRGVAGEMPAGVPRDEKTAMESSVATAMTPRRMPDSRERSWGEGGVDDWVRMVGVPMWWPDEWPGCWTDRVRDAAEECQRNECEVEQCETERFEIYA